MIVYGSILESTLVWYLHTFIVVRDNHLSETVLHSSGYRLSRYRCQSDVEYLNAFSNDVIIHEGDCDRSGRLSRLEGQHIILGHMTRRIT